jgi:hypothetical protein
MSLRLDASRRLIDGVTVHCAGGGDKAGAAQGQAVLVVQEAPVARRGGGW